MKKKKDFKCQKEKLTTAGEYTGGMLLRSGQFLFEHARIPRLIRGFTCKPPLNRVVEFSAFKRTIAKGADSSFRDITALGGAPFFILIILITISLKEYQLFQDLLIGFLITLFVVVVTRLIYFKNRPLKQSYNNLLERLDASSFPSLHAARILFLTLTLANYFQNRIITVLFLIIAATVSYSRIYLKKHDWIDIIFGLILGCIAYVII